MTEWRGELEEGTTADDSGKPRQRFAAGFSLGPIRERNFRGNALPRLFRRMVSYSRPTFFIRSVVILV
jgi:hypothetical protein